MDNKDINISIAEGFSTTPGARYRDEGDYSGQQFREEMLEPAFLKAKEAGVKVVVNLDGTIGYGTSFLEEVFGGLARKYDIADVLKYVDVISSEETYLKDDVIAYIKSANG